MYIRFLEANKIQKKQYNRLTINFTVYYNAKNKQMQCKSEKYNKQIKSN